ncbi:MAG: hypothetical protein JW798_09185 [Prolixibacteraceae bacterium]|nr:hypothetical protein [Prolixibacteraceae bacterium]
MKSKFTHYAASVGALLAVSGGVHAAIHPGSIMNGPDGDAVLDHHNDAVFIDINNDGLPDFIVEMYSFSGTVTTTTGSITSTFHAEDRLVEMMGATSCFIDNSRYYFSSSSYLNIFVRNNPLNNVIGPIDHPNHSGFISWYTDPASIVPFAFQPDFDGTSGDDGYIGVSMITPGGTSYGWIHINIGAESTPVTFDICAMEHTPNKPIVAGNSIPVPLLPIASAAGLGLIGLMAAMKKRKKVTA